MEGFVQFMQLIINFMKRDISLYGFTFSFWDIFMFSILASLVALLLSAFFDTSG